MLLPDWAIHPPRRPANDHEGDRLPDTLYSAVGRLAHAWEVTESSLASLFMEMVEAPSSSAQFAYGAIIGSAARCDMIAAAAKGYVFRKKDLYSPELKLSDITKYIEAARRLGGLRNLCVHSVVVRDVPETGFFLQLEPTGPASYFITPALYNTSKTGEHMRPSVWYASETVEIIRGAIVNYRNALDRFLYSTLRKNSPPVGDIRIMVAKTSSAAAHKVTKGEFK